MRSGSSAARARSGAGATLWLGVASLVVGSCTSSGSRKATPAASATVTATATPELLVSVRDVDGAAISGAVVMLNGDSSGARTTDVSGGARLAFPGFPLDVHVFSPHAAATPRFRPAVVSALGIVSGPVTIGLMKEEFPVWGGLQATVAGAVTATDPLRVLWLNGLPDSGDAGEAWGTGAGFTTPATAVRPGIVQITAIEFNASPVPSPVAAGFSVAPGSASFFPRIVVTPAATTFYVMPLDPIASLSDGTAAVSMSSAGGYDDFRAEAWGSTAAFLDHFGGVLLTEIYALGASATACPSGCVLPLPWVAPGSIVNTMVLSRARDAAGTRGSDVFARFTSLPSSHTPVFLPPPAVLQAPNATNRAATVSNGTGTLAHFVRYRIQDVGGGAVHLEVVRPALAAGANAALSLPSALPAGVPTTYLPQIGAMYEGVATAVVSAATNPSDLSAPALFLATQTIAWSKAAFVY